VGEKTKDIRYYTDEDRTMIQLDLSVVELVAGLIIAVGGATAIIVKVVKRAFAPITEPMKKIEKEVERQAECLNNDKKRLDRLEEALTSMAMDIDEIKETQVVILGSLFAMLQHMATGNATGEMNGELKKLTEFLAQK